MKYQKKQLVLAITAAMLPLTATALTQPGVVINTTVNSSQIVSPGSGNLTIEGGGVIDVVGDSNGQAIIFDNNGITPPAPPVEGSVFVQLGGDVRGDSYGILGVTSAEALTLNGSIVNDGGFIRSAENTVSGGPSVGIQLFGGNDGERNLSIAGGIKNNLVDNGMGGDAAGIIQGDNAAIDLHGVNFDGSIVNQGQLRSNGVTIGIRDSEISGGIQNSGLIDTSGTDGTAIEIAGGFGNSSGELVSAGVGNNFADGIQNSADGLIEGRSGINIITGANFSGGIDNQGTIKATGVGGAVEVSSRGFTDVSNSTPETVILETTFAGGITNSGQIVNTATGSLFTAASGFFSTPGIQIGDATVTGGLVNNGTIASQNEGVVLSSLNTWNGEAFPSTVLKDGLENNGSITSTFRSALLVQASRIEGGITNDGSISGLEGIHIDGESADATVASDGQITATSVLASGSVVGDLINNGTISGSVTEQQVIQLGQDLTGIGAITLHNGGSLEGNLINNASIMAQGDGVAIALGRAGESRHHRPSESGSAQSHYEKRWRRHEGRRRHAQRRG